MMKFRKNQNKEKQIPKEKKPRVYYKVNPHKKVVIALWVLLGLSFSFAIFKHFTAIDTHTIHETTIIEKEYVDTHHVENFVENFAKVYYSWEQSDKSIDNRMFHAGDPIGYAYLTSSYWQQHLVRAGRIKQ